MSNFKTYKNLRADLSYAQVLKEVGISYIGNVAVSAKLQKSLNKGTATYGIYLAPWNMARNASGFFDIPNVCSGGQYCHESCLNESGHNKIDILKYGEEQSRINIARIKKTILFYQNNPLFVKCVIHEIRLAQAKAEKLGYDFSVRLNCTSDISPEKFIDPTTGKNILELFPNVQFYDYTKVVSRLALANKYSNYNLTFSFDGHNWENAKDFISNDINVAVVFYSPKNNLPKTFNGCKVIDGNLSDIRYNDEKGCVIGLHYHPVAKDYVNHTFVAPKSGFVVLEGDDRAEW